MTDSSGRIVAGLALLVVLWIVVYWLWEPADHRPLRLTAAQPESQETDEPPTQEPTVTLQGPRSPAEPDPRRLTSPPPGSPEAQGSGDEPEPEAPSEPEESGEEAPPEGEQPEFREYVVRSGDSFGTIARRELGSARHAEAIARANPLKDPTRLRVGETIRIPVEPDNVQGRPEPDPDRESERTYQVRSGDTLSAIAQRVYGSSRHADFLYRANRDRLRSRDAIRVGQTLRVPALPDDDDG